jgi:glycosyltransferase domain-containing protein
MYNKFTIIVPTHNRTLPLARAVEYYSSWDCKIIVCDSSTVISNISKSDNIEYLHYPNLGFALKVRYGLEFVNTPFVCLCADDDFLSLHGVITGLDFLEKNKDYASVQGRYIQFNFKKNFIHCYPLYSKVYGMHINDDTSAKRLIASAKLGMHQIYSLHRTDILRNTFSICGDVNSLGCVEYNSNLVGMFSGKHIMLPIFWMARDEKRYNKDENLPKSRSEKRNVILKLRQFLLENEKGLLYRKEFSELYSNVTKQSVEEGEELFDEVYFNIYLPENEVYQNSENETPPKEHSPNIARNFIISLIPEYILILKRELTYKLPFPDDAMFKREWRSMKKIIRKYGPLLQEEYK